MWLVDCCMCFVALERIRQRAQQGAATDENQEEKEDEEDSSSDREVCESCATDRTVNIISL